MDPIKKEYKVIVFHDLEDVFIYLVKRDWIVANKDYIAGFDREGAHKSGGPDYGDFLHNQAMKRTGDVIHLEDDQTYIMT